MTRLTQTHDDEVPDAELDRPRIAPTTRDTPSRSGEVASPTDGATKSGREYEPDDAPSGPAEGEDAPAGVGTTSRISGAAVRSQIPWSEDLLHLPAPVRAAVFCRRGNHVESE
jgi:hypothetical protein